MPKSDSYDNGLLQLIFNAVTLANLADDTVTAPAATLTVALHTASPGTGGDQTTNEATYGSYARVTVTRDGTGWVITGGSVSPFANIDFPTASSGTETITHASVGTGVGDEMLYFGAVTPNIAVTTGVTPRLSAGSTIVEA